MGESVPRASRPARLGFGRACIECRRKKHRCDGMRPECSGCRSRGLDCSYGAATELKNKEPSTSGTCDALMVDGISHFDGSAYSNNAPTHWLSPRRGDAAAAQPHKSLEPQHIPLPPFSSDPKQPINSGHGQSSPVLPLHNDDELDLVTDSNQTTHLNGYFGDSSAFHFVAGVQRELQDQTTQTPTVQQALNAACSAAPASSLDVQAIYHSLPLREAADGLVDAYFTRVHLLYPFIHETSFRAQYESFWTNPELVDLEWIAILNMVFAYGQEFFTQYHADSDVSYVQRARTIILSLVFKEVTLGLTQALLLLCHYLQGALELNECWNVFGLLIRSTMIIGLHINPTENDSLTAVTTEIRKRVWWGCFVLDRTLSMKFGRPPSISATDAMEVDFPLEVDDHYIMESKGTPRQPGEESSKTILFVQTIKLAFVIDDILDKLYLQKTRKRARAQIAVSKDRHTMLGNIVLLDGQLQTWWDEVPAQLKPSDGASQSIQAKRQSNVAYLRYLQMRLLLQRPALILLAKKNLPSEYLETIAQASAAQCISVARETIEMICKHYYQNSLNCIWYILHYLFCSLGVLLTAKSLPSSADCALWGESDSVFLDKGMEFLRSVRARNSLAARYIALLENLWKKSTAKAPNNLSPALQNVSGLTNATAANHGGVLDDTSPDGFDFITLGFPDPNDFLFGMGLTQDSLGSDWTLGDVFPS